jgi:hypothetical protein
VRRVAERIAKTSLEASVMSLNRNTEVTYLLLFFVQAGPQLAEGPPLPFSSLGPECSEIMQTECFARQWLNCRYLLKEGIHGIQTATDSDPDDLEASNKVVFNDGQTCIQTHQRVRFWRQVSRNPGYLAQPFSVVELRLIRTSKLNEFYPGQI